MKTNRDGWKGWGIAFGSLLTLATAGAADYYVGRDGTEYAPGYQPADSYLVHHPDGGTPATGDAKGIVKPYAGPAPAAPTPFRTTAALRDEGTGWDVGIYGGVTPFQNGNLDITSPLAPGYELDTTTRDRLGGVAGLRFGYTWKNFHAFDGGDPDAESWVMPAVDYDLFWTGLNYKTTLKTGSVVPPGTSAELTADMNLITLVVDPMLKFRIGRLHPYVGIGVGGTYINAGNGQASASVPGVGSASAPLSGSSDTICFSVSPFVGAEFFMTQHWALTAEWKYLYLVDPKLGSSDGTLNYHSDGLGLQLATAGLKFYF